MDLDNIKISKMESTNIIKDKERDKSKDLYNFGGNNFTKGEFNLNNNNINNNFNNMNNNNNFNNMNNNNLNNINNLNNNNN